MSKNPSFIRRCINGSAFLTDIDDYIEAWHAGDDNVPIWRFLGMKKSEYSLWIERPEALRFIVAAHHQHVPVAVVLQAQEPHLVAARADHPNDAKKVIRWLEQTGRLD